jgi:hypothetical protein
MGPLMIWDGANTVEIVPRNVIGLADDSTPIMS